ncbi:MAG: FAD/NAD(P)-binding protein [Firmicutes bacterium]|nr:FAD/NAD(P)-binding protein [Bacillota bacterium]
MAKTENPYRPVRAKIVDLRDLTPETRLFQVKLVDPKAARDFDYRPGQFCQISALGTGEAPISISSSPTRPGLLEFCIRRVGRTTSALHRLNPNDEVGIRGPYGNGFPVDYMEGKDVLIVAGGVGLAPVRSLLLYILDNRDQFRSVTLLYGARSLEDMLFREELKTLERHPDLNILLTLDSGDTRLWPFRTGLVTSLFEEITVAPKTVAAVCVPPVAYKFVTKGLLDKGISGEDIFMSLERKMHCGIGKCGCCAVGSKYCCQDGPVFTYWDALNLPDMI